VLRRGRKHVQRRRFSAHRLQVSIRGRYNWVGGFRF
jgi:hypothetical protein